MLIDGFSSHLSGTVICCECGLEVYECASHTCEKCQAVCYCSSGCKLLDFWSENNPDHNHNKWCDKMKAFMAFEPILRQIPLSMAPITTSPDFGKRELVNFLKCIGVLGRGLWKYEFDLSLTGVSWDSITVPGSELHMYSALWVTTSLDANFVPPPDWSLQSQSSGYEDAICQAFVIPSYAIMMSLPPNCLNSNSILSNSSLVNVQLSDWKEYYDWRGLGRPNELTDLDMILGSSSLALLLHWPLTLYYIISHKLPQLSPGTIRSVLESKTLTVHVIGVEKELSLLPVFKELDYLFAPHIKLRLAFVGPYIDPSINKVVYHLSSRLSVTVWCGLYHEFLEARGMSGEKPDVVIGFNAGLAAYGTWPHTLKVIYEQRIPAFFTDSCLYSCSWGFRVAGSLNLGPGDRNQIVDDPCNSGSLAPVLNPFRSPIRMNGSGVRWGWFSNAFIFAPLSSTEMADSTLAMENLPEQLSMMQM